MVEVVPYHLPPTDLIPNSPHPLLHYKGLLARNNAASPNAVATQAHELFVTNGWQAHWIYRYGPTQRSHYHSRAHECMIVLCGSATVRFGVADTGSDSEDLEASTHGTAREAGGIEVEANAGDVFVLPAGTAHKTFDTVPNAEFALLTPGHGHGIEVADGVVGDASQIRRVLKDLSIDGFAMLGAYPIDGSEWDFATGGDDVGAFDKVWAVKKPAKDPVLGNAPEGIEGMWQ